MSHLNFTVDPTNDPPDPTSFAFNPYDLAALVDPRTLEGLDKMGGVEGICAGLGTNRTMGLSARSLGQSDGAEGQQPGGDGPFVAPLSERQRFYGTNSLPMPSSSPLLRLLRLAYMNKAFVRFNRSHNFLHSVVLIPPP
jgi:P-type Ca2+ transporter type 2C